MEKIRHAAGVIRNGGLVAFPTVTVYGIGADAFDEDAVSRVYAAKGRPSDNPMIVHIARASDISLLTDSLSPEVMKLAGVFWPGPLTMVLKKKDEVPFRVTGGLSTVGVRIPDSPVALELIRLAGKPVAAPSANISGCPSPTRAEHVIADLEGKVDVILAGAECRVGIESTVVDMTAEPPQVLRPGVITREDIEALLDIPVGSVPGEYGAPRSPGMKYTHYAPKAKMLIVEGAKERVCLEIQRLKSLNEKLGLNVGLLLINEKDYLEAAHLFYAELRELDEKGADVIIAGALPKDNGIGYAVMNRMMKAAGYNVVRV
jgi:L-threonylcarbamoyladenylate synthase